MATTATAPLDLPMRTETYSQDTYWGRVRSLQQKMNPLLLFARDSDVHRARDIAALADAKAWGELRAHGIQEEALQKTVLLRDASVNPSSGEVLPRIVRLAAFAPVNIPICAGLLLTAPTVANSVFWQWVNQTYNAAFNYAYGNRPHDKAQKEQEKSNLIKGYSAAVVVSVGIAVGLNAWLKRVKARPFVLRLLQGTVPFTAVAGANVANVFCMRGHECINGIPVSTENGTPLGVSKRAGFQAVLQTALCRVVAPMPILLLPGPIISFFNVVFPITGSTFFLKVLTELSVIYGCLSVGLPMGIALFPSTARIPVSDLEPQFQGLNDKDGAPVTHVVFNRGM